MKKLYHTLKFKEINKRRALDRNKRRLDYLKWRRNRNKSSQGVSREKHKIQLSERNLFRDYKKVVAPDDLSFLSNTESVINFINILYQHCDAKRQVFVELENVKTIDYAAIVVLLSIMVEFKARNIKFNGDFPIDIKAKELLMKSGFIQNLFKPFKPEDRYKIIPLHAHAIHTHAQKNVDARLGQEIIFSSSQTIWNEDRRCQGVQRTLLELMQNTNNHAEIGRAGGKHWWVSVNHIKAERKVCFSFIDFGVGVFTSLENKPQNSKFFNWSIKLKKLFSFNNNAELLKLIMEGKLHQTVTEEHYRGKGLPGIAEVAGRNQISNLHIITNDVFCDFSNGVYRTLTNSFTGTFVYWEVNSSNENCRC